MNAQQELLLFSPLLLPWEGLELLVPLSPSGQTVLNGVRVNLSFEQTILFNWPWINMSLMSQIHLQGKITV